MRRLIYVIAFTPNFDRMREFYEQGLGLKVHRSDAPMWVEYDTAGARLSLHAIDPDKRGLQMRFEASDLDADFAAMRSRGVRFEGAVGDHSFGRLAEFWDPEDRLLTVLESRAPFQPGAGMALKQVILNSSTYGDVLGFYREKVGLSVADDLDDGVVLDTGPTALMLRPRQERDDAPLNALPRVALAFEVGNLDQYAETLRGRDLHFASVPAEEEDDVFAEILDPDGNVLVFRQPLPPPSIEEQLAEEFEDDEPLRVAIRKPIKAVKAVSLVAIKPTYREPKSKAPVARAAAPKPRPEGAAKPKVKAKAKAKARAIAKAAGVARSKPKSKKAGARGTRGAGPAGSGMKPKNLSDTKKARTLPATGRMKKATRENVGRKKTAVAGTSKARPVKKASARKPRAITRSSGRKPATPKRGTGRRR
jgi:catechol 2,3-dioxygenase-like lactoylglutathione lyase family enzyme